VINPTHIVNILTNAREQHLFPGCVIGYTDIDSTQRVIPFGTYTFDPSAAAVTAESIFDIASITKAIPTASLALYLLDKHELRLSDQIVKFLPNIRHKDITIHHLLTQSVDLHIEGKLSDYSHKTPDEIVQLIFTAPLRRPPGTSYLYTNATSILLGLVIEEVTKKPLDKIADEIFFTPLKMNRTTFYPEQFDKKEIVPTEITHDGIIQGIVHDESARTLSQKYVVGSAGLFSTVGDLLLFLQMLLSDGVIGGKTYFSPQMISHMATSQPVDGNASIGLGWELNQRQYIGTNASNRTISKTGFTGCVVMADLDKKHAFVMLSNYTYPKRKTTYDPLNYVRAALAESIFSQL
jgi:CubicO group peptidase (beta-lactamase class C family)